MARVGIGMRSLKTGLAVFICFAIYSYIPLTEPTLAVLVAVMAIQNTIDDSVTFSKNRLIGTLLGTVIGIIYTQIAGDSLVLVAIGVIVLITLLNKLNQSKNIVIALVLFVNIITGVVSGNPIIYGLYRFANTLVGITVGFLINYFIKPPNQIKNLKMNAIEIVDEIEAVIKELIFTDDKIDLKVFKEELQGIEASLDIYNQDKKYHVATMDKIKYVEKSFINYTKLYGHILIVKDRRATLDEYNVEKVKALFNKDYICRNYAAGDWETPEDEYHVIYNYHIKEIMNKLEKIRSDLGTVSKGKAVRQGLGKQMGLGRKDKEIEGVKSLEMQEAETKRTFMTIGFALFIMLSVIIGVQNIMALSIHEFAPGFEESVWYIWSLTGVSFYCIGFPLFLFIMKGVPDGPKGEVKKMSVKQVISIFFISMAAAYIFNIVGNLINVSIGAIKGSEVVNPLLEVVGGASVIGTAIFAGILAPIIEEVIFRGVMLDKLRGYGDKTAIMVSALTFGLFHGNLSQFFYAFVLGLIFGYVALKTNTIKYTVILHILINMLGAVLMPALVLGENPMLIFLAGILVIIIFIAGITLYIRNVKEITLEAGEIEIDPSIKVKTVYFNGGMILFYLICSYLFINVILA